MFLQVVDNDRLFSTHINFSKGGQDFITQADALLPNPDAILGSRLAAKYLLKTDVQILMR